ncbi:uncharacterized protein LOC108478002 [Gossypium arboreum]|uniref:uncharacterized protein LOC108478002 n=1 Tax=Gossypium arboreum TaxID=29729 RepID=UPI0008194175|nr:uncharacterized protein LOC108478002 [Gossypium arboreum]
MINAGVDNEESLYPPGFTPTNAQACLQGVPIIKTQQNQAIIDSLFPRKLVGATSKWYNQLSRTQINSWKDLLQAFMKQYSHVTVMTLDRITLQSMEKKPNESFRQYAQRWRKVAMQVQPPLIEKETTMLFINTLKASFINHMLGSITLSFSDMIMPGELIENVIRSRKIDAGESAKRSTQKRNKNEVNIVSMPSKLVNVGQPRVVTTSYLSE